MKNRYPYVEQRIMKLKKRVRKSKGGYDISIYSFENLGKANEPDHAKNEIEELEELLNK